MAADGAQDVHQDDIDAPKNIRYQPCWLNWMFADGGAARSRNSFANALQRDP